MWCCFAIIYAVKTMKKDFTTGLIIVLPLLLTAAIVGFLINVVTKPFLGAMQVVLKQTGLFLDSPLALVAVSKVFILLLLMGLIYLIGFIGHHFFVDYLFRFRMINKIYQPCRDVVHSLFSSTSASFSRVVLVPFPNAKGLCFGFVVQESDLVSVFVPGTPNLSGGYLLKVKPSEIIALDMKVEEGLKCVVSCAMVMPEFKIIGKE